MLRKLNALTTFKGTMNRTDYWFYLFLSVVITALGEILILTLAALLHPAGTLNPVTLVMIGIRAVFGIAAVIVYFCGIVRRLHDVNLTGYLALLFFVAGLFMPLLLLMLIVLGCVPQRSAGNRYLTS